MKRTLALIAFTAMIGPALPAVAASGISYDSVTKFAMGGDTSSLAPGNFDADFQTASQPPEQPRRGGFFGGINATISAALASAASTMAMFRAGIAERHYIAASKERTDTFNTQTATILDCQARTLTTLNLKDKTYTVVSLDQPMPSAGAGRTGRAQPPTADDTSKVAVDAKTRALGPRQIGSDATDGYQADVTMTVTRADGQTGTSQMSITEYLTKNPEHTLQCSRFGGGAGPMAALNQYAILKRAMSIKDPRFTVTSSGPALPSGRLSAFTMVTMSGSGSDSSGMPQGGSFTMMIERAHERAITTDDPVFSVPADFTKSG